MTTKPGKAFRLRRYHAAFIIVLISVLVFMFFLYFDKVRAEVEHLNFRTSITAMHNDLYNMEFIRGINHDGCLYLDNENMFVNSMAARSVAGFSKFPDLVEYKTWAYDSQKRRLYYSVRTSRYFRSPFGKIITVDFLCRKRHVEVYISQHQWCKEKGIFGCNKW